VTIAFSKISLVAIEKSDVLKTNITCTVVSKQIDKVTLGNLVIALGIIYGDIGTSPLYVLNAIINGRAISELLIVGSFAGRAETKN